jgi:hypothetical protein
LYFGRRYQKLMPMKFILVLLLTAGVTQVSGQPGKKWTEADRDTIASLLAASKAALIEATKGLTEKQLSFKPTDTSWSIKGVVEHLASYAEYYYWELVVATRVASPQYLDSVRCSDEHFMYLADNPDKHVAVDLFIPRDKYGDFQNTLKQYAIFKDAILLFNKNNKKNLREHFSVRPAKGVFDCRWRDAHQVILVEVAHVFRHLKQVDRIKTSPGFPRG